MSNTLLDNDRIEEDLKQHLTQAFGTERQEHYWSIFEKLRVELGYADYLGALQRYRSENPRDPHFLQIALYLLDYPFANRLFQSSLDVVKRLRTWGPTVILSDGDVFFSSRARSSAPGCSRRLTVACSSTSTKSGNWTMSRSTIQPVTTSWWIDVDPLLLLCIAARRTAR
jgi:hypothetical protein